MKSLLVSALFLGLVASTANAQIITENKKSLEKPAPFNYGGGKEKGFWVDFNFEKHIYGYVYFNIDRNTGEGFHRLVVTSQHRTKSVTVCMNTSFVGGTAPEFVNQRFEVNKRGANEATVRFRRSPEDWAKMQNILVEWGYCPATLSPTPTPTPISQVQGTLTVECKNFSTGNTGRADILGFGPSCQGAEQDARNKAGNLDAFCKQKMMHQGYVSTTSSFRC